MSNATIPSPEAVDATTADAASTGRKRGRVSKPTIPVPEGGFTSIPANWNEEEFALLKESNFAETHSFLFYEWKAARLEHKAGMARQEADFRKRFGSNKAATKYLSQLNKIKELEATLSASGVNVAELRAAVKSEAAG